ADRPIDVLSPQSGASGSDQTIGTGNPRRGAEGDHSAHLAGARPGITMSRPPSPDSISLSSDNPARFSGGSLELRWARRRQRSDPINGDMNEANPRRVDVGNNTALPVLVHSICTCSKRGYEIQRERQKRA